MSSLPSPTEQQNPVKGSSTAPEPRFFVKAFASGLFSGYSPVASGTVGSLVGLAFYFIPGFEHPYVIMPLSFFVFLAGINASQLMENFYGHDPAEVTIDEVLGMWMSLWLLPKGIPMAIAGFVLFRIFDVVKPFPARKFDVLKGGAGIMLDDLVAAAYTNIILHILLLVPITGELLAPAAP